MTKGDDGKEVLIWVGSFFFLFLISKVLTDAEMIIFQIVLESTIPYAGSESS